MACGLRCIEAYAHVPVLVTLRISQPCSVPTTRNAKHQQLCLQISPWHLSTSLAHLSFLQSECSSRKSSDTAAKAADSQPWVDLHASSCVAHDKRIYLSSCFQQRSTGPLRRASLQTLIGKCLTTHAAVPLCASHCAIMPVRVALMLSCRRWTLPRPPGRRWMMATGPLASQPHGLGLQSRHSAATACTQSATTGEPPSGRLEMGLAAQWRPDCSCYTNALHVRTRQIMAEWGHDLRIRSICKHAIALLSSSFGALS